MARRQTGDGWMDVGFFDVNARGNTSSIMATTAVVNFYILRATSPSLEIPFYNPSIPTSLPHSTWEAVPQMVNKNCMAIRVEQIRS